MRWGVHVIGGVSVLLLLAWTAWAETTTPTLAHTNWTDDHARRTCLTDCYVDARDTLQTNATRALCCYCTLPNGTPEALRFQMAGGIERALWRQGSMFTTFTRCRSA